MKWNLFDSNKVSLNQIKISSNQINFCLKLNKLYLRPYINALISLFWRKIFWFEKIFIWRKDILFELNKCYLIYINLFFESKKAFKIHYFLSFNQIFFLNGGSILICFKLCLLNFEEWIRNAIKVILSSKKVLSRNNLFGVNEVLCHARIGCQRLSSSVWKLLFLKNAVQFCSENISFNLY